MISGDEKEQIRRSIMRAFDTFYHQYYRDLFAGTPDKAGTDAAAIEDHFLLVRACDIGSHMRVLDRRTRSRPAMRHRTVLVKAAICSMARDGFEMSELGDGPDGGARGYTDRHRQRLIHERYGDAFLGSEAGREPGDGRVKRLSTVFSEGSLPRSRDADRARALLDAAGVATYVLHKSDTHRRAGLNSFLRLAFPQFLSDMLGFRTECRAVFESLGERNERIDFLREQIVEGSGLLDLFYSQLSSILDVAWFRTLPEDEQKPLLMPAPEARYGPEDARKAGAMLSGIYGRDPALHLLDVCGKAFLQFGRPQAAALVFMQCTGMAEDDMQRGTEWQNVAATYRISQNFKLALGAMKKALPHFEAAGDPYRVCNALQLTGEFQWRLGFQEAAWRSFREMESRSMDMKASERWKIPSCLGMTFGRLGDMRQRRRFLVRALEMIPEEETDTILRTIALINDEHPMSPDDTLHPALREELDEATDKLYEVLLGRGDQASQTQPDDAGLGPVGRGRAQDRGGGA